MIREIYGLGYTLGRSGERLEHRSPLGRFLLDPSRAFVLSGAGLLSSKALELISESRGSLALRKGFRIAYAFYRGCRYQDLLLAQLRAHDDWEECLHIASKIVQASTLNKIALLEGFKEAGFDVGESIRGIKEVISGRHGSIESLRRAEAKIAKMYFEGLREVIDPLYGFESRTRRPPKDCFSAALSYANMMLYRYVEAAILAVGLEPRIGYLHQPFRKRLSLALDLSEVFRQPVVDSAILPAFMGRIMSISRDFRRRGEAVYLSPRGRGRIAKLVRKRMNVSIKGRKIIEHIWSQVFEFSEYISGARGELRLFTIRM